MLKEKHTKYFEEKSKEDFLLIWAIVDLYQ